MRTQEEIKEAITELKAMKLAVMGKKNLDYFQSKIDSLEWVLEIQELF